VKPAGAFCGVVAVTAWVEQATFRADVQLSTIDNSLIARDLIRCRTPRAIAESADIFVREDFLNDTFV
jgi:hypothetical protein